MSSKIWDHVQDTAQLLLSVYTTIVAPESLALHIAPHAIGLLNRFYLLGTTIRASDDDGVVAKENQTAFRNAWKSVKVSLDTHTQRKLTQSIEDILSLDTDRASQYTQGDWEKTFSDAFKRIKRSDELDITNKDFQKIWEAFLAEYKEEVSKTTQLKHLAGLAERIDELYIVVANLNVRLDVHDKQLDDHEERIKDLENGGTDKPSLRRMTNITRTRNPYFTGRKDMLDQIYANFQSDNFLSRVQSIYGLGGVGKTSIALQYAFTHMEEYDTVWWVNAETPNTVLEVYRTLVTRKQIVPENANPEEIIEAVRNWFFHNDKWLFIYDNSDADSFTAWLEPYFPQSGKGHVLVTTRSIDFPKSKQIGVTVFDEAEAVSFLYNRTQKSKEANSEDSAKVLCNRLQLFPLALEQAGAYIAQTPGKTYQDYIKLFDQYGVRLFSEKTGEGKDFRLIDYSSIINTTWQISMRRIKDPSAVQMFNICAYLASNDIPLDLFVRGQDVLPIPLREKVSYIKDVNDDILIDLCKYSLLTVDRNEETATDEKRVLGMHRLLQEVVRDSFGANREWLDTSLNLCNELASWDAEDINSIRAFRTDAVHMEQVIVLSEKNYPDNYEKLQLVSYIYYNLVDMYIRTFDVKAALQYSNRLISILKASLDVDDGFANRYNLMKSHLNRGNAFELLRDYDNAIADLNICIALGEQLQSENEQFNKAELAAAYMNRGVMHEYLHSHNEALADKNMSIDLYERLRGEGMLADENGLALAYMNRGATYESMDMYGEALDDDEMCIQIWKRMREEGKLIDESSLAKTYVNIGILTSKSSLKQNQPQIDSITHANMVKGVMASYKKRT